MSAGSRVVIAGQVTLSLGGSSIDENMVLSQEIMAQVGEQVVDGNLEGALEYVANVMNSYQVTDYHQVLVLDFRNNTWGIVASINKFIAAASERIDVQSIYLEMNAFYINSKRWYFDFFAFKTYMPEPNNLDWLSDWQNDTRMNVTLIGMEHLQETYLKHQETESKPSEWKEIIELTDLAVVLKFMKLIKESLSKHKLIKSIPVLCSAHDYDIVYRFLPPNPRCR